MVRSAWGVSVSLSLALLSAGSGSVAPGGGVTVAVLTREPVAAGSTRTVKLKVTVAPTGRSTVVARGPVPLAGPGRPPPPPAAGGRPPAGGGGAGGGGGQ